MSNRFVIENATKIVAFLRASGIDPNARIVPPDHHLAGGCGDPQCCGTHPGVDRWGNPMVSVKTIVSNNRLHKIAIDLGLKINP